MDDLMTFASDVRPRDDVANGSRRSTAVFPKTGPQRPPDHPHLHSLPNPWKLGWSRNMDDLGVPVNRMGNTVVRVKAGVMDLCGCC